MSAYHSPAASQIYASQSPAQSPASDARGADSALEPAADPSMEEILASIRRIIADHAYILQSGRIELSGPADEIARNEKVVAAYLGG